MRNPNGLTDTEEKMLAIEAHWFKYAGAKDQKILELGMSPTRYYQLLHDLVDTYAAQRFDPITCRRVQDLKFARRDQRSADRLKRA